MPFPLSNQQCQSTEEKKYHIPQTCSHKLTWVAFQLCLWPLKAPGYIGGRLPLHRLNCEWQNVQPVNIAKLSPGFSLTSEFSFHFHFMARFRLLPSRESRLHSTASRQPHHWRLLAMHHYANWRYTAVHENISALTMQHFCNSHPWCQSFVSKQTPHRQVDKLCASFVPPPQILPTSYKHNYNIVTFSNLTII